MTPSQQEQKDRARDEAEHHQQYGAVDGMRDYSVNTNNANEEYVIKGPKKDRESSDRMPFADTGVT